MKKLTIGRIARRAGVGVETVRFYERQGLIAPPPRSDSGYRLYPEKTIQRLAFIRRAKELGFSLQEIKELLALQNDPLATCTDIQQRAERKLTDISRRISDLEKMRTALQILVSGCSSNTSATNCPIMQAITGG